MQSGSEIGKNRSPVRPPAKNRSQRAPERSQIAAWPFSIYS
jgi:hypothetical protein